MSRNTKPLISDEDEVEAWETYRIERERAAAESKYKYKWVLVGPYGGTLYQPAYLLILRKEDKRRTAGQGMHEGVEVTEVMKKEQAFKKGNFTCQGQKGNEAGHEPTSFSALKIRYKESDTSRVL